MTKPSAQRAIVLALLAVIGAFTLMVWLPRVSNSLLIGLTVRNSGDTFEVVHVYSNSPAEQAGLRAGDRIVARDGVRIAQWRRDFDADLPAYLARENRARESGTTLRIERAEGPLAIDVYPRRLTVFESVRHFGTRFALVATFAALVLFIVLSKPRDPNAFLICVSFCIFAFWLLSDSSYSPVFFAPVLVDTGFDAFILRELIGIAAVQIGLSTILHIALVFPERRAVVDRHSWPLPLAYIAPTGILAALFLATAGTLSERLNALYDNRMWLDSLILLALIALVADNYRTRQSPTQREQTKWVCIAIALVATWVLVLWNLPQMLVGHALVPNYDWVLASIVLVPAALTASVTNHELLGVRGIIRRRIRVLEGMLQRERSMAARKDERLESLGREIEHLRSELARHAMKELQVGRGSTNAAESAALTRLEERHPRLRYIRQSRLLSASPRWEGVFEQIVLAARGVTPVLVVGESGTGKTDISWAVHHLGDRFERPYREVSCAQFEHADPAFALGRLFGIGLEHGLPNVQRGGQKGLLEECDGGTLFLDDFDRLPLSVQDLLLYPLEGKAFRPGIGAGEARSVSIKFVLAVNRDPDALVSARVLRADVVARLGLRIDVPPLRDRMEDIPILVEHFTARVSEDLNHPIKAISSKALSLLSAYDYPRGNVREVEWEIRAAIGRAMLQDDTVLRAGYLSARLQGVDHETLAPAPASDGPEVEAAAPASPWAEHQGSRELEALRRHAFRLRPAERDLGLSSRSRTLSNHLRGMCVLALAENAWDVSHSARALAGPAEPATIARLEAKMRRHLQRIDDSVAKGAEEKLFNNLPMPYRDGLRKAIGRARERVASGEPK